ncbi:MAG TPA: YtxH domain-containing protein [Ktedonobacterales bacterium]|jgi:gas vesicle protein
MRTIRAFIWGGAIGAVIGLLFAPRRGEETRTQLQSRLNDLQGQAQTQLDTVKARSSDLVEQGRQAANTRLRRTQQGVDTTADSAQDMLSHTGSTN